MKYLSTPSAIGLATLAAVLAAPAAVAQPINSGWYLGGSIGRTTQDPNEAAISHGFHGLAGQGLTTTSIEAREDRDRGYKLFGGYQFHRNFAVEGGYFDLGSFGYTAHTLPLGTQRGDDRYRGLNLDLVGILPFTDKFSALARIGVIATRATGSYSATGAARVPADNPSPAHRSIKPKFGVGLMYDFTPSLAVRAEAERYRVEDSFLNKNHIDMISVGLVYRFGAPARVAQAAPAPVYVAPPPAPAPVYVAPPPPPPAPAPAYVPPPPPPAPVAAPEPRPAKPYRN